jgi:hypothetical protein
VNGVEDEAKEKPYVPPGGYSTWWDVLKPLMLMVGVIVGVIVGAFLFGRQIVEFVTQNLALIAGGTALLALHLLYRVEKLEKQLRISMEKLPSPECQEVQSNK